ncbi:MAG: tRNA (N6-isopentenyl adenosine(37)-C2)-methylthiotransferase MiaB [Anaerolineae bacterium]|nr:tRNA (N6-isopentenyl adenosine(37)-C2)-methylthiotransferase MiaB [Anaerolineae bacterium]
MSRFYIWTIGCQMNRADSLKAADELKRRGHVLVGRVEDAGIIVLNTCVVRQSAENKVIGRLTSLKSLKRGPDRCAIVVMGCFVDDLHSLEQRFPYVDAFLAPSDIDGLVDFVERWDGGGEKVPLEGKADRVPMASLLPISYGCDHHCTYCIVTLRRGPERSRPLTELVREAEELVARGAVEITFLGQNVDSYGHDLPGQPNLADLLRAIHDIESLQRIRFLTSHPADFRSEITEAVAELPKVCEHFELAVQAGDDQVLRRMGRGYTVDQFRQLIARIRGRIPDASIATDVIVGFPGESVGQFEGTVRLIRDVRFDVVHIAAYSPRPGTRSAQWDDDVPATEKTRRRRLLEEIQERIAAEINARLLGQTVEILVEERNKGKWRGRTRTNKLVFFEADGDWLGRLVSVEVTWTGPWSMQGKIGSDQSCPV